MSENALYNALAEYNKQITNDYSKNWGSLLNFMEDDTGMLAAKVQRMVQQQKKEEDPRQQLDSSNLVNFVRPDSHESLKNYSSSQNQNTRQLRTRNGKFRHQFLTMVQNLSKPNTQTSTIKPYLQNFQELSPQSKQNPHLHSYRATVTRPTPLTSRSIRSCANTISHNANQPNANVVPSLSLSQNLKVPEFSLQNATSRTTSTFKTVQEFNPQEKVFVYKSFKRNVICQPPGVKTTLNSRRNSSLSNLEEKSFLSFRPANHMKASVQSRRTQGYTEHGFPSTLLQGKPVQKYQDTDPAIENANLVQQSNTLQNAIKVQRRINNEQQGQRDSAQKSKTKDADRPPVGQINQMDRLLTGFSLKTASIKEVRDQTQESRDEMRKRKLQNIAELIKLQRPPTPEQAELGLENLGTKLYQGNLTADQLLRQRDSKRWVHLRKNNKEVDQEEAQLQKNLQFAKDLFISWDVSGDGSISEDEAIKPLVSLGLAPDHKFAIKIWQALKPNRLDDQPVELYLEEFLRIFRPDKVSDQLMQMIKISQSNIIVPKKPKFQPRTQPSDLKSIIPPAPTLPSQVNQILRVQKLKSEQTQGPRVKRQFSKEALLQHQNTIQPSLHIQVHQQLFTSDSTCTNSTIQQRQSVQQRHSDGLAEQTDQIKILWRKLCQTTLEGGKNQAHAHIELMCDLPVKVILQWVCQEGIAQDPEKALGVLDHFVGKQLMTPGMININEFMKLFQKGMFKNALLKLANTFEKQGQASSCQAKLSLAHKLHTYQRTSMIKGIDKNSETHKDIKKMLNSLKDITLMSGGGGNNNDLLGSQKPPTYSQMIQILKSQNRTLNRSDGHRSSDSDSDDDVVGSSENLRKQSNTTLGITEPYKFIELDKGSLVTKNRPQVIEGNSDNFLVQVQKRNQKESGLCFRRLQTVMQQVPPEHLSSNQ